jgi:UDP-glucose:(heptosyl)LPS alpha-1,3-glucosyltransferase
VTPHLALLAEGLDPRRGGAERAVRAVAEAVARRGVPVVVYAPADRAGPELSLASRVAVPVPRLPRPARALALARALPRAARRDGARVLVACGKILGADAYWPHGGLHRAARRARVAAGRSAGGAGLARALRLLRATEWAFDAVEDRALRACREGASRCLALSDRVRADLVAAGLSADEVPVVRNGVDPARFSPGGDTARQAAREALRQDLPPATPLLLLCAQDLRLKGLDVALRALPRLPHAHLLVAGRERPDAWRGLARRLGVADRVRFLGQVEDMPATYRGADALVHPTRYDPCSLVVLEALACGLPVVASRLDGASELIPAGGGGAVDPEDPIALAAAVAGVLAADPKQARTAAAAAVRTWDAVARDLLAAVGWSE